jgi:hypothetical protein
MTAGSYNTNTKTSTDSSSHVSGSYNTNTKTNDSTNVLGALRDSVVGSGSLSQTTTYSPTTSVWTGDGSAVTSATLNGNHIEQKAAASSGSGTLSMSYSMAGQGILQANLRPVRLRCRATLSHSPRMSAAMVAG